MFSLESIKFAHSKVKSGADFPAYIQEIKVLGVTHYVTYVENGNADYYNAANEKVSTGVKYPNLTINKKIDAAQFKADLLAHQQGKTDFPTFCNDCAKSGIEKWVIDMNEMTCIYHDIEGNEVLVEVIPH